MRDVRTRVARRGPVTPTRDQDDFSPWENQWTPYLSARCQAGGGVPTLPARGPVDGLDQAGLLVVAQDVLRWAGPLGESAIGWPGSGTPFGSGSTGFATGEVMPKTVGVGARSKPSRHTDGRWSTGPSASSNQEQCAPWHEAGWCQRRACGRQCHAGSGWPRRGSGVRRQ